jgi:hypothetical protein
MVLFCETQVLFLRTRTGCRRAMTEFTGAGRFG